MTPAEFVDLVKRDAHFGALGSYTDQPALDMLKKLNMRLFQIWRFHSWDWSLDDISLTVGPSTYNQTLPSTTGDQYEMGIQGQTKPLRRVTRKQYLAWEKLASVSDTGGLVGYIPLGRDSSGNIKLRFFAAPSENTVVEGWAKKRLTALTTADWQSNLAYFPVEMQDIIYTFLLSDAYRYSNDDRAEGTERKAYKMMEELRGDVEGPPDSDPTSPPPDYVRFVQTNRGSGTGVV